MPYGIVLKVETTRTNGFPSRRFRRILNPYSSARMFDCRSFKTADPAVAEILQLINRNCAQHDLSLNLLSRKANLSNRHLGRLFQKHTGKTSVITCGRYGCKGPLSCWPNHTMSRPSQPWSAILAAPISIKTFATIRLHPRTI